MSGDRAGAAIAAIENLVVPSPGAWMPRLWREDEAGNQEGANASETVRLRFAYGAPSLFVAAEGTNTRGRRISAAVVNKGRYSALAPPPNRRSAWTLGTIALLLSRGSDSRCRNWNMSLHESAELGNLKELGPSLAMQAVVPNMERCSPGIQ